MRGTPFPLFYSSVRQSTRLRSIATLQLTDGGVYECVPGNECRVRSQGARQPPKNKQTDAERDELREGGREGGREGRQVWVWVIRGLGAWADPKQ